MDITTFVHRHRKLLVPGLLLLIFIALATLPSYGLPLGMSSRDLYIAAITLMYSSLAVSWAMFSGSTGYMSLGTAAFFGVGIYATSILREELSLGFIIAVAALVSFLIALLVGLVTLRLKGIYFAIFTFGLVMLIGQLVLYYEIHILGIRGRNVVPASYENFYYIMLGLAVVTLLVVYFIRRSKLGLAMLSIGGNEEAAAHMGVNTTMVKVITFAISATFMGVAGSVYATRMIFVDPAMIFHMSNSFTPVLMAIFGGMGNLFGPVIGATVFSLLEFWLSKTVPYYYPIVFGIILIIVILYLPNGIVGLVPTLRGKLGGVIARLSKGGQAEPHVNT
jgi:branched-chain amino acid transport system permease protein